VPAVSVIIPAYGSHGTIAACLESLERQSFRDFETIVIDSSPDARSAEIVRARFSWARVRHSERRLLPHAARNVGVELAAGAIIAFTDPDCVARSDWLERLVAAHRSGHSAVGGAISTSGSWWQKAVHMTKFAWWLPGGAPCVHRDMATANASYARSLWDSVGPFLAERFAGDTELNWRVFEAGARVWFEPRAIVSHQHHSGPSAFLRERLQRGHDFARMRVAQRGWSRGRCLAYGMAAPLLPLVMLARAAGYAAHSGHALAWLLSSPVQLAGHGAWCLGEAAAHWRRVWAR
jgi:GT2 family glycosyltransferase